MHLECCKYLVGVADVLKEESVVCWRCLSLGNSFYGSFIDDTQHLTPDVRLNLVGSVESVIYLFQELAEDICIKADGVL